MDTRPLDPLDQALLDLGIPPKPPLPPREPELRIPPKPPLPTTPEVLPSRGKKRAARIALALYIVALTMIAIWPVPVDREAGPMLRAIGRVIPIVTYARIEFAANIVLFVPLGVLLALILSRRYLVVPISFVTTVAIESIQGIALALRTPSVMDVVANVTGACIGLLLVATFEWWRRPDDRAG
jgi:hypothetical protein